MILLQLFVTIIIVYNVTQILVESTLFSFFRRLPVIKYLFNCFLCTSVWVGFLCSWIILDIIQQLQFHDVNFTWFWSGIFYSGIAYLVRSMED